MVATRRSSSRLTKKQKLEPLSSDEMDIDNPASSSLNAHQTEQDEEIEDDDDFQKPLPMPAKRLELRSSPRNKGKGKAKLEESSMPPSRPKLEREASLLRGRIAKIKIENYGQSRSSSSNNTASTSASNSVAGSSNATSPTSIDDTEYELDGSVMADSAVASPRLPSALTEFDSGSQQVSDNDNEGQDHDEADLELTLSNILTSRRNPNIHIADTDDDEDELVEETSLSSSSSEAESTSNDDSSSEDDLPLINRTNNRRRRAAPRRRPVRQPHVSGIESCSNTRKFTLNTLFLFCL